MKLIENLDESIDIKSGYSKKDIEIFKRELLENREKAQGDYAFTDNEIKYILNEAR